MDRLIESTASLMEKIGSILEQINILGTTLGKLFVDTGKYLRNASKTAATIMLGILLVLVIAFVILLTMSPVARIWTSLVLLLIVTSLFSVFVAKIMRFLMALAIAYQILVLLLPQVGLEMPDLREVQLPQFVRTEEVPVERIVEYRAPENFDETMQKVDQVLINSEKLLTNTENFTIVVSSATDEGFVVISQHPNFEGAHEIYLEGYHSLVMPGISHVLVSEGYEAVLVTYEGETITVTGNNNLMDGYFPGQFNDNIKSIDVRPIQERVEEPDTEN